jgi:hypothetical protein
MSEFGGRAEVARETTKTVLDPKPASSDLNPLLYKLTIASYFAGRSFLF